MKLQKRDGREVEFDKELIGKAVYNAAMSCGIAKWESYELGCKVAKSVADKFSGVEIVNVEDVQDAVEYKLMCSKYKKDVAKSYIEYRAERCRARNEKNIFAKIGIDITTGADSESQRENSNVPRGTISTQTEMIKRLYSKNFVNEYILPEKLKVAHNRGEIHIHDAAELITKMPNCILMDYPFMLKNGFQLGNKWIEDPTSINTAMNVLVQMCQAQAMLEFGGITLPDVDVHLGKYVIGSYRKHLVDAIMDLSDISEYDAEEQLKHFDNIHPESEDIINHLPAENKIAIRKTNRETYKSCRLLSYQMNTLSVRGESSPFTTIGYGNSTTWEGRLIQKSILQERMDEFKISGVQEFPKHMMAVRKGVNLNPNDPNYDLFKMANKSSALSAFPDYIFPENQEEHTGGSAFYMG